MQRLNREARPPPLARALPPPSQALHCLLKCRASFLLTVGICLGVVVVAIVDARTGTGTGTSTVSVETDIRHAGGLSLDGTEPVADQAVYKTTPVAHDEARGGKEMQVLRYSEDAG